MALKVITLDDGSSTADTHTVAAATTTLTGESGFIQDIFTGEGSLTNVKAELKAGGIEIPLVRGAYLPEGAILTNEGEAEINIIINIG